MPGGPVGIVSVGDMSSPSAAAVSASVSITGTGLWAPPEVVTNAELVVSLTASATRFNDEHSAEIESGSLAARALPDEEFIVKASGIKSRHVVDKAGGARPRPDASAPGAARREPARAPGRDGDAGRSCRRSRRPGGRAPTSMR